MMKREIYLKLFLFCCHHLIGLHYANSFFIGNHRSYYYYNNKDYTTRKLLNKKTPSLPLLLSSSLDDHDATIPVTDFNSKNPGRHTGTPTDMICSTTGTSSRKKFLSLFTSMHVIATTIAPTRPSNAQEETFESQTFQQLTMDSASDAAGTGTGTDTIRKRTITGCPKSNSKANNGDDGKFINNCVSTSNIKQLDTYSPPWTFQVTPDEAFARLKGIVNSDPSLELVEIDEKEKYLKVETKRLAVVDYIEFLVKDDDQVVVFQSAEKNSVAAGISDFGAIRKRLEELRKKSGGVFNVMGEGFTADSFDGGASGKRNGFGGQLKAFYGFNSGQGYESVFE